MLSTCLTLTLLAVAAIIAVVYKPLFFFLVPVSIEVTYWGWWFSTPPALVAHACFFASQTRRSPASVLFSFAAMGAWLLTALGVALHTNARYVEFGLALSIFAPVAMASSLFVLHSTSKRLQRDSTAIMSLLACGLVGLGMASYVAILTVLYFDYSTGLDLYLGSINSIWIDVFIIGGLSLFVLGAILGLVVSISLVLARRKIVCAALLS